MLRIGNEAMITAILPNWVSVVEASGPHCGTLFPEEEELLARALPKRRAEFAAGRTCARNALANMGIPPRPILRATDGAPVWPDGVVGSITHCSDYCAAAVAYSHRSRWIGIDAEPNEPLPEDLLSYVASAWEIEKFVCPLNVISNWGRFLFSAKESVYKVWFSIRGTWLDFKDVSIEIHPSISSFSVIFEMPEMTWFDHRKSLFCGQFSMTESLIFTSAVVSAEPEN